MTANHVSNNTFVIRIIIYLGRAAQCWHQATNSSEKEACGRGRCNCRLDALLCAAGDQEPDSTQRLPSVDDSRSTSKVPDDLVTVKPQDNV